MPPKPTKEETRLVGVRMDVDVLARLRKIAERHGLSVSDVMRNAIRERLPLIEKDGLTFTK